jgi:hypothetical protein
MRKSAVIFDLDGVLCNNSQELHDYMERNPYPRDAESYWGPWCLSVPNHPPSQEYVELARILHEAGEQIIILTARPVSIVTITRVWLDQHLPFKEWLLVMSPGGDGMFHQSKENHLIALMEEYTIQFAIDDSQHWCEMYRRYNIPTLWVNHGLRSIAPA